MHKIIGIIPNDLMVQPPHILSERDWINDNVVEALVKAALNLKPENTWTKVLESTNYYEVFLGALATHSRNAGKNNCREAVKLVTKLFRTMI